MSLFFLQLDSLSIATSDTSEIGLRWYNLVTIIIIGAGLFFFIRRKILDSNESAVNSNALLLQKQKEVKLDNEKQRANNIETDKQKLKSDDLDKAPGVKRDSKNREVDFVENKIGETRNDSKEVSFQEPIISNKVKGEEQIVIIYSRVNHDASNIKRIGYMPSRSFEQGSEYSYPFVAMPPVNCKIKFPRKGRSNKIGFKEPIFFKYLMKHFPSDFKIYNDRLIPTASNSYPYEPDFVLICEKEGKNIFVNVEIDEPYDAYSRTPTHELKADINRDNFFTQRGWIVVRFTEKQIHTEPDECCRFVQQVISSIMPEFKITLNNTLPKIEKQWSSIQAKKWARENYRENYLGIVSFGTRSNTKYEYVIENSILDQKVEQDIPKKIFEAVNFGLSKENCNERDKRIVFEPNEHRYFIDGNSDTISVSQLIDKFFPEFDSEYWSLRKANQRGVEQALVLQEWEDKRVNSANLGTSLHEQIENYYNGMPHDSELPEFRYFKQFTTRYPMMIPYRSEWRIFDEYLLIAGTVDMVYQKEGNELFMFDWKRSAKVVDSLGLPIQPNFDSASGGLSHLSDNSYNRYALQQNIYKYILEKRYNKKISSMNLLILHPDYGTYHRVVIPDMTKEVEYVFEASKSFR